MRGHTFSSPKRAISKRSFVFAVYGLQKDAFSPLTYAFERFFIAGIASEPNLFITCAQVTSEMTNVTAKKDNRQTASVKRRWRGNFLTCYNAFTDETIKVRKWVKACKLSRSAKYKYLKTIKTTSLAGGMHRAFKAKALATSKDVLKSLPTAKYFSGRR